MDKIDFVSQEKQLYSSGAEPEIINVPVMQYLMIDGQGAAEDNPVFQHAFQALYGVAYNIKFTLKKGETLEGYQDFKVPPPEGLWWMADGGEFDMHKSHLWRWTLMVRMPEFVSQQLVRHAIAWLVAKKKDDVYMNVRLQQFNEGKSVQMLHTGPYDTEAADLAKMDNYTEKGGLMYHGKHHEIYFGDPRRTKPGKLRTILRHPIFTK